MSSRARACPETRRFTAAVNGTSSTSPVAASTRMIRPPRVA